MRNFIKISEANAWGIWERLPVLGKERLLPIYNYERTRLIVWFHPERICQVLLACYGEFLTCAGTSMYSRTSASLKLTVFGVAK
ncbi:hypothetical protein [Microcoleus sp. FACHB-672]|uniref:hypothetical protein n=1 Tax=Microcoleus sp. FACHB-672 TaxID=2692825 RepID=UPI001688C702|nr:hypothetical protein [Microcoleus sp. FACHB-672]MBD2042542.1 hypothetical protein [Microcoleus sp. FACHB-672]